MIDQSLIIYAHTYTGPGPTIIIFGTWVIHLIPLLLISVPLWCYGAKRINARAFISSGLRRVEWNIWDASILVLPFALWFIASSIFMQSVAGFFFEGLILGFIAPLSPISRVLIGSRYNQKKLAFGLVLMLCFIAVGIRLIGIFD